MTLSLESGVNEVRGLEIGSVWGKSGDSPLSASRRTLSPCAVSFNQYFPGSY
jgi:hypothetical protein